MGYHSIYDSTTLSPIFIITEYQERVSVSEIRQHAFDLEENNGGKWLCNTC